MSRARENAADKSEEYIPMGNETSIMSQHYPALRNKR